MEESIINRNVNVIVLILIILASFGMVLYVNIRHSRYIVEKNFITGRNTVLSQWILFISIVLLCGLFGYMMRQKRPNGIFLLIVTLLVLQGMTVQSNKINSCNLNEEDYKKVSQWIQKLDTVDNSRVHINEQVTSKIFTSSQQVFNGDDKNVKGVYPTYHQFDKYNTQVQDLKQHTFKISNTLKSAVPITEIRLDGKITGSAFRRL